MRGVAVVLLLAMVGVAAAVEIAPTALIETRACDPANGGGGCDAEDGDCHPKCQWKCDSPVCNQVCEPLCEEPRCSTRCQEIGCSKCEIKCEKPECEVRCPVEHCEQGECPQCDTVCKEPVCHTECTNPPPACESVCEEPLCDWKCHRPADCAKPKCALVCEKAPHCQAQPEAATAAAEEPAPAGDAVTAEDALHLHCLSNCEKEDGDEAKASCRATCDNLKTINAEEPAAEAEAGAEAEAEA